MAFDLDPLHPSDAQHRCRACAGTGTTQISTQTGRCPTCSGTGLRDCDACGDARGSEEGGYLLSAPDGRSWYSINNASGDHEGCLEQVVVEAMAHVDFAAKEARRKERLRQREAAQQSDAIRRGLEDAAVGAYRAAVDQKTRLGTYRVCIGKRERLRSQSLQECVALVARDGGRIEQRVAVRATGYATATWAQVNSDGEIVQDVEPDPFRIRDEHERETVRPGGAA